MKNEPDVNRRDLMDHINSKYSIDIEKISFIPVGEFAYSYQLQSSDKKKYFLKMYESNRLTKNKLHSLDFSIDVAYQLNQDKQISQVIFPIKTKVGLLKTNFASFEMVIWSYVEGSMIKEDQRNTKEFMTKLGELLARIHKTTDSLNYKEKNVLDFELDFKNDLLISLKEATECVNSKDKNYNKLQRRIKPQMDNILQSLIYLEELAEGLKGSAKLDSVICHSDPINHNILNDKDDEIHLIDWDSAILAPYELDIWFYLNDKYLDDFIYSYRQVRKVERINEDFIAFLFYKRILEDLTDWIYRILFEEITKEQIESDFAGLEEDIFPVLPNMKKIENKLRENARKWIEI